MSERHRHRYEVNNAYREQLEQAGLVVSGKSPDGRLVEFVELPREVHPFYAGTQAHPELKSRPTRAHPLFRAFVAPRSSYNAAERLPVEIPEADPDALPADRSSLPPRNGNGAARHDSLRRAGLNVGDQDEYDLVDTETVFDGRIIAVRRDEVRMSDGSTSVREVVAHPGAVGIVALDDDGRRRAGQPVPPPRPARLDELPAGLLDVEGEPALDRRPARAGRGGPARSPTSGTCWSTCRPRPASPTRRSASTSRAGCTTSTTASSPSTRNSR